jgi:hypothetical protein
MLQPEKKNKLTVCHNLVFSQIEIDENE